jgi:hypothetical protein
MFKRASPKPKPKPAERAEPQVYRKPRADVYTVLLSLALIAVATAATVLWLTMAQYHYEIKGGPNPTWNRPATPVQELAALGRPCELLTPSS